MTRIEMAFEISVHLQVMEMILIGVTSPDQEKSLLRWIEKLSDLTRLFLWWPFSKLDLILASVPESKKLHARSLGPISRHPADFGVFDRYRLFHMILIRYPFCSCLNHWTGFQILGFRPRHYRQNHQTERKTCMWYRAPTWCVQRWTITDHCSLS